MLHGGSFVYARTGLGTRFSNEPLIAVNRSTSSRVLPCEIDLAGDRSEARTKAPRVFSPPVALAPFRSLGFSRCRSCAFRSSTTGRTRDRRRLQLREVIAEHVAGIQRDRSLKQIEIPTPRSCGIVIRDVLPFLREQSDSFAAVRGSYLPRIRGRETCSCFTLSTVKARSHPLADTFREREEQRSFPLRLLLVPGLLGIYRTH